MSVFDFLVTGETPNATPHTTPNAAKDSEYTKVLGNGHAKGNQERQKKAHEDDSYMKRGYTYGEDPISIPPERPRIEYITPGPKYRQNDSQGSLYQDGDLEKTSTDKKRKRTHVEELDLTTARRPSQEPDARMEDAPPVILHSGLTGGLNRLLSKSQIPPSPDYPNNDDLHPPSPPKRSKSVSTVTTVTSTTRGKDSGVSRGKNGVLVKVRKRRSSDESLPPKKQQRSHHSPEHDSRSKPKFKAIEDTPRPKRKAVEYHSNATDETYSKQLTVPIKSRAELFMSFVTKGPESEQGYSVHKALKRYHRERGDLGLDLRNADDEDELWRNLRLKRNDRGEIVVFF